MDSTGDTNSRRYPVITLLAHGQGGRGLPVAFALANVECGATTAAFLSAVHKTVGRSLCPHIIMVDMCDKEAHGISLFRQQHNIPADRWRVRWCFFHVMQAVQRWCQREVREPDKRTLIRRAMQQLAESREEDMQQQVQALQHRLLQAGLDKVWKYLQANYLRDHLQVRWLHPAVADVRLAEVYRVR